MKMVVQKISDLIDASGLTAESVEKMTGLSKGRISKWKSGQGEPTATQALRLARLLKVAVESLVDDDQDVIADQNNSRMRVVEIANEIGWDGIWRRLLIGNGAVIPPKKINPGDYQDLPIQQPGDSPRAPRKAGGS